MKRLSLAIISLCFLCVTSYAQKANLSSNATELFKTLSCKLTTSEKNTIAELSGFSFNENDKRLYRTAYKEEANMPFDVSVFVLDLTNDGLEEISIRYSPKSGLGKKGVASMLFVKDKNGQYKLNIDVPGEFYFLNINNLAFPDVLIKNTTVGLPTYRWDGNQYNKHKLLNPSKLKKFVVNSLQQASRRYTSTQVGE